jgi:eukaryotic-like serine/threonine-protein kinase
VFKFITHRHFFVNLLVIIVLTALLIWGFLQMLGVITKHGEYLTVPKVLNKPTSESIKFLESKGFTVVVQDSVYTDTAKLGSVLKQFPEANSMVKVNRVVMLTVNRVTLPLVDMPNLIGKSQDYAMEIIKRSHLTLGDTIFVPSFMMGAVVKQTFKGGEVAAASKIPWGSKIDLEIGAGLSDQQFIVPSLLGLTFKEAKAITEAKGIMLTYPIVDPGTKDTANAFVYKQNPPSKNEDGSPIYIRAGQLMDVYVNKEMKITVDSATIAQDADKNEAATVKENSTKDKKPKEKK